MKENTNKSIAINSIILYIKLLIITITGLLTTRFALQALGVIDYGLFSVVGGIISFVGIFNTVMLSVSNRFISVEIGKGDIKSINEQFNINLFIHVAIAILTLLLAIPLGDWYIYKYVNYAGDISNAISVFHYSVIGAIISFVGVPYNGVLIAKERFLIFSIAESFSHIVKMIIAYILIFHFENKLGVYAFSQAGLTAITTFIYYFYCKLHFSEIVKIKLCKKWQKYKEVFKFAGWVAFGAFATIGKNQGAALLINSFFNTIMNTALGLANTVSMLINQASSAIAQPIAPQITKSYASGDFNRCNELLIWSTKFTFFVTLIITLPFFTNADWIFTIWLGQVPPYLRQFTTLIIIDTLVLSLNSGISNIIFASGNIKNYQVITNVIRISSILAAFLVLKMGAPAFSLLYVYIIFSIVIVFSNQWILHRTLQYDNSVLFKKSYLPSLLVFLCLIPLFIIRVNIHPILQIIAQELYLIIVILIVGITSVERYHLIRFFKKNIA